MTTASPAPRIFTQQEKSITLIGLMVVFLLSALDQTIVSTAMPRIIEQLRGLEYYSWVTTAYLLASTVMVPIYGKLSDLYGRKPILIIGIALFLLGSALCGMSGEAFLGNLFGGGMLQLIVFRGLQGLGGAALFTSAFAIIADMFPPAERAKFGGLFGAVFGLSSVLGPIIGGFLTDHGSVTLLGYFIEGWRWVFYVNLPLGAVALFMIIAKMPSLTHKAAGKIDYLGAVLIIATTIPLLLALTWGGTTYPWDSARIITLFAVSAVSLVLFILAERRNKDAILPLDLFQNRTFTISNLASFIINMAFIGIVMFLPLFMQTVQGVSATNSGLSMLPLMAGLILSSITAGNLVSRTGNYKPFLLGGTIILILGVFVLTQIDVHTTRFDLGWRMFIVGLGLGPSMSLFNIAIQNAVPLHQIGVATSSSQFFRQIGTTIGAAIFGTLLLNNLQSELPKYLPKVAGMENAAKNINLGEMRASSGNNDTSKQIKAAFDQQYQQIERAFNGDAAATQQVLQNPQLPAELKATLKNGGIRAQVHTQLTAQANTIAGALQQGEAGRQALLGNAQTPDTLKTQLRALPAAALATPQAAQATARQVQQGILASEAQVAQQATTSALSKIRQSFDQQATKVAQQISDGMKLGFTAAVKHMIGTSIWIILVGLIFTFLLPVVPLRKHPQDARSNENEDAPAPTMMH
ncbi:MDR family MFS transporter [Deinococcus maricopensis]|uniref:Drug resistance transporter, EmrB/QacA subfamily n=1 Tax=Deinococcus maricopensis (strain DSM 21211 / LMG 22137 / NRRL B-23946 / LB-34) TaxID=709986 RepID=E8U8K0_DEIML|nr:MDR family MFS transporter [Deinococcus maricopensis]ADV67389.1 drug resistance transporter, EmrB/QacA subfamily [Deinococcus maricopensis DSM 21211]